MDLDLAFRVDRPTPFTTKSSLHDRENLRSRNDQIALSLMIIKRSIPEAFKGAVSDEITDAKDFLTEVEKYFVKNDKNETITLWGEALKTVAYTLNRVPSKAASKTPYEIWTSQKPSLKHLHIWGSSAEERPFRSFENKLDSKTVTIHVIVQEAYEELHEGNVNNDPTQNGIFVPKE
ncbi:hypothetical protein LIER_18572 [Lithospermum erythrorhizon]|uniref:Uncharacterized protein n=1 Tax=Lithospermum erythrorhizon TaxID=34254 RepID=A0AAV3QH23_LITER